MRVADAARTTFPGLWRTVVRVLSVLGAVALIGLIGALLLAACSSGLNTETAAEPAETREPEPAATATATGQELEPTATATTPEAGSAATGRRATPAPTDLVPADGAGDIEEMSFYADGPGGGFIAGIGPVEKILLFRFTFYLDIVHSLPSGAGTCR